MVLNLRSEKIFLYLSVLLFSTSFILLFLLLKKEGLSDKTFLPTQIIPYPKPSKERMGFFTWNYMHSLIATLDCGKDDKLDVQIKKKTVELIHLIQKTFPCQTCSKDFGELLEKYPPNQIETKKEFGEWLCNIHNLVNLKLNKPKFDCDQLEQTYKILKP